MTQTEKITSIRRTIHARQQELGLDSDLLTYPLLRKFQSLENLPVPKTKSKGAFVTFADPQGRFKLVRYKDLQHKVNHRHHFKKVLQAIAKGYQERLTLSLEGKDAEAALTYLKAEHEPRWMGPTVTPMKEGKNRAFALYLLKKYANLEVKEVYTIQLPWESDPRVGVLEAWIPDKAIGGFKGVELFEGAQARIVNLAHYQALALCLETVKSYLQKSEHEPIIKQKWATVFDATEAELEEVYQALMTYSPIESKGSIGDILKSACLLTLEHMLKEAETFRQLEAKYLSSHSDYAKSYTQKKNIPKKIEAFMADNEFLTLFEAVEADELSDLEKLGELSLEFKRFLTQVPLPECKDDTLRFRRLGRLKAAGAYFPGFGTLALDLDGISSFMHEWFHLIDYRLGLVSTSEAFRPILVACREAMQENVNKLPAEDERRVIWMGKSKFNHAYYTSSDEIFARMGELYLTQHLKLDSSFNKTNYGEKIMDEIVYPKQEELLDLAIPFYHQFFLSLGVSFPAPY